MGFLRWIKTNSRRVSDAVAGSNAYFELASTNLSLRRRLAAVFEQHVRGRTLDAGAGRQAYRRLIEPLSESYESLDVEDFDGRTDHVADLQAMSLSGATFDTVVCTQVLQHVPEPGAALREIARVLRPGGHAILSVPHLVWLHNEPYDYYRFTCYGLRHLIEKAGLRPVSVEPVGGLICFLAYAPSDLALAVAWPVRPLFHIVFWINRLYIRFALCLDRLFGLRSLYPTNYVAVAVKP